jgi:glycosyltransferase involved in cell wall biosynthesis
MPVTHGAAWRLADLLTSKPRAPRISEEMITGRVVLAHDYFTQAGGAERVAAVMASMYPDAPVLTAAYLRNKTFPELTASNIRPLWRNLLSRLPDVRWAYPLLAAVFLLRRPIRCDALLVSTSGWAHLLPATGRKVIYVHNPARWIYQVDDYFKALPRWMHPWIVRSQYPLRLLDRRAMRAADELLANSTTVAERIQSAYGRTATVVHPPPGLTPDGPVDPLDGLPDSFYLTIGRSRGYKNDELAREACSRLGVKLVQVGGRDAVSGGDTIQLGRVTDANLRWLLRRCNAVICMSREDFGLVPLEAFGQGAPVIALSAGGFLDTCIDGRTGAMVPSEDVDDLIRAIRRFETMRFDRAEILAHAATFGRDRFEQRIRTVLEETS